jgi:hypothetical protein
MPGSGDREDDDTDASKTKVANRTDSLGVKTSLRKSFSRRASAPIKRQVF